MIGGGVVVGVNGGLVGGRVRTPLRLSYLARVLIPLSSTGFSVFSVRMLLKEAVRMGFLAFIIIPLGGTGSLLILVSQSFIWSPIA